MVELDLGAQAEALQTLEIGAQDELVYRVLALAGRVTRAGVELVFDDGSIEAAPKVPSSPEPEATRYWHVLRIPLAAHAGRKVARVRLTADGLWRGTQAIYFDDLRIVSGDTTRFELALESLPRGPWKRDEATNALALVVSGSDDVNALSPHFAPAEPGDIAARWAALDLSTLRRREGRVNVELDAGLPTGLVWSPAGAPLSFGASDGARAVPAAGQRVSLAPVDGGRFYELHLALRTHADERFDTLWRVIGSGGESRERRVSLPATDRGGNAQLEPGEGQPGERFFVIEIPIASAFSISSVQFPGDERVEILALSARWRQDALANAHFRRAWLESERATESMRRYVADIERRGDASEEAHERELVERLLADDVGAADQLVDARIQALEERGASSRGGRIALVPCLPQVALPLDHARALDAAVAQEKTRLSALQAEPTLKLGAPDARTLALVAERDPATLDALRAAAAQGRIDVAPLAWTHGEWGLVGEEALVQQLARGIRGAQRWLGARGDVAWVPSDLAWNGAVVALASRAGLHALASAPIDFATSPRAPFSRWSATNGASLPFLTPPRIDDARGANALLSFEALDVALDRCEPLQGERALWTPFDAASDPALARANRARIDERMASAFGARVRIASLSELARDARAQAAPPLPSIGAPAVSDADSTTRCRSDEVHALAARAEARLIDAQTWTALAVADGLSLLPQELENLWTRVLDLHAALASGSSSDEALAEARAILERCETLEKESLTVLARGADTRGLGQALIVFNPLAQERTALFEVQDGDFDVVDVDEHALPSQVTHEGKRAIQIALPPLGYSVCRLIPRGLANIAVAALARPVRAEGREALHAELGFAIDGGIRLQRAAAVRPERSPGSEAEPGEPGELVAPVFALELVAPDGSARRATVEGVEVLERGPLRALVRLRESFGDTRVRHEVSLVAGSDRIEVTSHVEGFAGAALRIRGCGGGEASRAVPFGLAALPKALDVSRRVASHGWISSTSGWALVSPDIAACGRSSDGEAIVWMSDAASGDARDVRWAVATGAGAGSASEWSAAARELAHPVRVLPVGAHEGARLARHSFVRVVHAAADGRILRSLRPSAALTCFAPAQDGEGWTLRLADTSGDGGSYILEFDRPVFDARRTDVVEQRVGDARVETSRAQGARVELRLAPWGCETLRLSPRPQR